MRTQTRIVVSAPTKTDPLLQSLLDSDLPVMVTWKDAHAKLNQIWFLEEELQEFLDEFDAHEITSVGVLAGYSDQCILLVMGVGGDEFQNPFGIPRSAITSIRQLMVKPEDK